MSSAAMRHVICYDIPSDKRRAKLARCLDSYGDRVQFSVFEATLDRELLDNLVHDVDAIILPAEDRVQIFPLCASCNDKVARLGKAAREVPPGEEIVFIA